MRSFSVDVCRATDATPLPFSCTARASIAVVTAAGLAQHLVQHGDLSLWCGLHAAEDTHEHWHVGMWVRAGVGHAMGARHTRV